MRMGIALAIDGVIIMFYPLYFKWLMQFGVALAIIGHIGLFLLLVGILGAGTDAKRGS